MAVVGNTITASPRITVEGGGLSLSATTTSGTHRPLGPVPLLADSDDEAEVLTVVEHAAKEVGATLGRRRAPELPLRGL